MLRNIDLSQESDGRFYSNNDMVKTDCGGCIDCSSCCHSMGTSIVLDPYDVCQLTFGLNTSIQELLAGPLELNVADGIILPNLKMKEDTEGCFFLDQAERCGIHNFRPGICRLFPLGRYYEDGSFLYFLQTMECPYPKKGKIKIKKWLGISNLTTYEEFIKSWHYFLKPLQEFAMTSKDQTAVKQLSIYILQSFYMRPYENPDSFYEDFKERLKTAKETLPI